MSKTVVYDPSNRMGCYLVKGMLHLPPKVFNLTWDKTIGRFNHTKEYDEALCLRTRFQEKGLIVMIREESVSAGLEHIYESVWATVSPPVPKNPEIVLKVNSFEFMGEVVVPTVQEEGLHYSYKLYPLELSTEEQLRRIGYLSKKFTLSQTETRIHLAETDWIVTKAEEKIVREAAALKAGESQACQVGGFKG